MECVLHWIERGKGGEGGGREGGEEEGREGEREEEGEEEGREGERERDSHDMSHVPTNSSNRNSIIDKKIVIRHKNLSLKNYNNYNYDL